MRMRRFLFSSSNREMTSAPAAMSSVPSRLMSPSPATDAPKCAPCGTPSSPGEPRVRIEVSFTEPFVPSRWMCRAPAYWLCHRSPTAMSGTPSRLTSPIPATETPYELPMSPPYPGRMAVVLFGWPSGFMNMT